MKRSNLLQSDWLRNWRALENNVAPSAIETQRASRKKWSNVYVVKPHGTAEENASWNIGNMAIKLTVSSRNDVGHSSWSIILYWLQRDWDFDYAASNSLSVFGLAFFVSVQGTVYDGNWYLYREKVGGITYFAFWLGRIEFFNCLWFGQEEIIFWCSIYTT